MLRLVAAITLAGCLSGAPAVAAPLSQPASLGQTSISGALVAVKAKPKRHLKSGTPPGWSHGRKVGWRGGNIPPGHHKKQFR